MKAIDLPEKYKKYTLSLSDKSKYTINGLVKEGIVNAPGQFLQLHNGTVINRNHIVAIHFEKEITTQEFRLLPEKEKRSIVSSIETT